MCPEEIYRRDVREALQAGLSMDIPERRVIGALLLLLGVSSLAVGLYIGQLDAIVNLLGKIFP
jgi:hypothetical protein